MLFRWERKLIKTATTLKTKAIIETISDTVIYNHPNVILPQYYKTSKKK